MKKSLVLALSVLSVSSLAVPGDAKAINLKAATTSVSKVTQPITTTAANPYASMGTTYNSGVNLINSVGSTANTATSQLGSLTNFGSTSLGSVNNVLSSGGTDYISGFAGPLATTTATKTSNLTSPITLATYTQLKDVQRDVQTFGTGASSVTSNLEQQRQQLFSGFNSSLSSGGGLFGGGGLLGGLINQTGIGNIINQGTGILNTANGIAGSIGGIANGGFNIGQISGAAGQLGALTGNAGIANTIGQGASILGAGNQLFSNGGAGLQVAANQFTSGVTNSVNNVGNSFNQIGTSFQQTGDALSATRNAISQENTLRASGALSR